MSKEVSISPRRMAFFDNSIYPVFVIMRVEHKWVY